MIKLLIYLSKSSENCSHHCHLSTKLPHKNLLRQRNFTRPHVRTRRGAIRVEFETQCQLGFCLKHSVRACTFSTPLYSEPVVPSFYKLRVSSIFRDNKYSEYGVEKIAIIEILRILEHANNTAPMRRMCCNVIDQIRNLLRTSTRSYFTALKSRKSTGTVK